MGALSAPTGPTLGARSLCKTMDRILHPKVLRLLWGLRVLGSHVPKASILARGDPLARASVSWGPLMFAEWTDCRRVGSLGSVGTGGLAGAGRGRKGFRGLLCASPPRPPPPWLLV